MELIRKGELTTGGCSPILVGVVNDLAEHVPFFEPSSEPVPTLVTARKVLKLYTETFL